MTSKAQRLANLRNAVASTGPRSQDGKARTSRNALRHGLSARIFDVDHEARVDALARALFPQDCEESDARAVAEATLALERIGAARVRLLQQVIQCIAALGEAPAPGAQRREVAALLSRVVGLERYERRTLSRRRTAIRLLDSHAGGGGR